MLLFPNGNGRHSRLVADIMISKLFNKPVFSWGHSDLSMKNPIRKDYLDAIYKADNDDYKSLTEFAKKTLATMNNKINRIPALRDKLSRETGSCHKFCKLHSDSLHDIQN
jgi:hypothetical protein